MSTLEPNVNTQLTFLTNCKQTAVIVFWKCFILSKLIFWTKSQVLPQCVKLHFSCLLFSGDGDHTKHCLRYTLFFGLAWQNSFMESYGQQRSCDSRAPLGSRRSSGLTWHSLACNCRAHAPKLDLLHYSLRRSTTFGHSIHFSTLRIFGVFNTLFKPGQFQVPKSSTHLLECKLTWA